MLRSATKLVALPFVALSAEEAATALRRAGFHPREDARVEEGLIVLERGSRVVILPAAGLLDPEALRALMKDAGLDYVAFLERLDTPLPLPLPLPLAGGSEGSFS